MRRLSPVVAATAASQNVQQPPVGRSAFASLYFLSVLLLLWLLSPWTLSLYRVLLEFASVASLSAALWLRRLSPVMAATAASRDVQQPPVGRAAFASVSFLSVQLLLWLLSPWTPSLYRVLLASASVASLSAAL